MRKTRNILGLGVGILLSLVACTQEKKPTPPPPPPKKVATQPIPGMPISVVVRAARAQIHDRPPMGAHQLLHTARRGDSLLLGHQRTEDTETQVLGAWTYEAPWVEVVLKSGERGWIFGGAIEFDAEQQPELASVLYGPRIDQLAEENMRLRVFNYMREMNQVKTLDAFRMLYTQADALAYDWNRILTYYQSDAAKATLDFDWLEPMLPGLTLRYWANVQRLCKDLKVWQQAAAATYSKEDDYFVDVLLKMHALDSLQLGAPAWRLEVDSQSYSLLGRGVHQRILTTIDSALQVGDFFEEELLSIKQQVIDDISTSSHYWLSKTALLSEIDSILGRPYPTLLTRADSIELQARRKALVQAEAQGIYTNAYDRGTDTTHIKQTDHEN